ncbi:hypothetical protein ACH4SP_27945 [Streptomyces sp. NPDC021093]|uniref:hypothetical protein n=1 Tax=Streptomyces sp. NPDC021093 TaxID=3365112 RepID=UPI0037981CC3
MTGTTERRTTWPTLLPDLFSWVESGIPGLHTAPGLHSIRIEESLEDGTYILRAELPGIDADKDVELTIAEGICGGQLPDCLLLVRQGGQRKYGALALLGRCAEHM